MLDNFDKTSADLNALTSELKEADIAKTIKDFDTVLLTVNTLMASIESGEGTMGKLLKEDGLYKNLESASKEMELLLLDIKLHPARYRRILSKKEIPYEEPTEDQKN